jgi:hypothetical protein
MSTFGKKALAYWDYDSKERLRYNHTPMEVQLAILEKWYPIGSKCTGFGYNWLMDKHTRNNLTYDYIIINYDKTQYGYCIKLDNTKRIIANTQYHPLNVLLSPDCIKAIKRDKKIDEILKK